MLEIPWIPEMWAAEVAEQLSDLPDAWLLAVVRTPRDPLPGPSKYVE